MSDSKMDGCNNENSLADLKTSIPNFHVGSISSGESTASNSVKNSPIHKNNEIISNLSDNSCEVCLHSNV